MTPSSSLFPTQPYLFIYLFETAKNKGKHAACTGNAKNIMYGKRRKFFLGMLELLSDKREKIPQLTKKIQTFCFLLSQILLAFLPNSQTFSLGVSAQK